MPRRPPIDGAPVLRPTCKDMKRREFKRDGKDFVMLEECKQPSVFAGMCLRHYAEFARELLAENEATIRGLTKLLFEARAELKEQAAECARLRRALVTKLHPKDKLRGGSVSQSFVGSNG